MQLDIHRARVAVAEAYDHRHLRVAALPLIDGQIHRQITSGVIQRLHHRLMIPFIGIHAVRQDAYISRRQPQRLRIRRHLGDTEGIAIGGGVYICGKRGR